MGKYIFPLCAYKKKSRDVKSTFTATQVQDSFNVNKTVLYADVPTSTRFCEKEKVYIPIPMWLSLSLILYYTLELVGRVRCQCS